MNINYLDHQDFEPRPLAAVNDSQSGIYGLRDAYQRPIGPQHCDDNKRKSLAEFQHRVVRDRLDKMTSLVYGSRQQHKKNVDAWSQELGFAASPEYIPGGKWT
jgi:hypothetical protein